MPWSCDQRMTGLTGTWSAEETDSAASWSVVCDRQERLQTEALSAVGKNSGELERRQRKLNLAVSLNVVSRGHVRLQA